jgi:hypothetical protein
MGKITVNFSERLEEVIVEKYVRLIAYHDDSTYAQAIIKLMGFVATIKANRTEQLFEYLKDTYNIEESEMEWLVYIC